MCLCTRLLGQQLSNKAPKSDYILCVGIGGMPIKTPLMFVHLMFVYAFNLFQVFVHVHLLNLSEHLLCFWCDVG